jgi:hypothetical protein
MLIWSDVKKSGAVFGLGNILLLSIFLDLPLLAYFIQYGGFILLGSGFVASKLFPVEDLDASAEQFVGEVSKLFSFFRDSTITPLVKKITPLVMWKDFQSSVFTCVGIYFFSTIVAYVGILFLFFVVFNFLFVYGKTQDIVVPIMEPHFGTVYDLFENVVSKIPRYEGAVAPKKVEEEVVEKKEE